ARAVGRLTISSSIDVGVDLAVFDLAAVYFFFQAGDGIRYRTVTGVQTCALPIFESLVERGTAMPRGPERDALLGHRCRRNLGVIGRDKSCDVDQRRWVGGLSCQGTYLHCRRYTPSI